MLPRAENRSERSFKTGFADLTQYLNCSFDLIVCVYACVRACVRERDTHTHRARKNGRDNHGVGVRDGSS